MSKVKKFIGNDKESFHKYVKGFENIIANNAELDRAFAAAINTMRAKAMLDLLSK